MTRASTQFGTSREIASRIEYCTGKHTPKRKSCARERERAFALAFLDIDVGVLAPVLLL